MTRTRDGVGCGGCAVTPAARVLLAAALAGALPAALGQRIDVAPSLLATVTATHRSGSGGAGDGTSEVVARISPGITLSARGGLLQGSLSYRASALVYANDTDSNRVTHALASRARYSILGGRAGVDASAAASEDVVSAFGVQGSDAAGRDNRAQTFSYSLAPYLSGRLLGSTSYHVRLGYAATHTGSEARGRSESLTGSAGLSGRLGVLRWGLDASRQVSESRLQGRTHVGRVFGSLGYAPDVELQLTLRLGRDIEDLRTGRAQSTTTWGAGAVWTPGPRTTLSADYDRRYFGDAWAVRLSHRMASTVWTFSDSRSVRVTPSANRFEVSAFELFFTQFASIEPDPLRREQLVNAFLAAQGIDPAGRVVVEGFLSSLASVQRRQQFSAAYQGRGNTAVLTLSEGRSRSVVQDASGVDDLAGGNVVRQRGLSLTLSHRLTPGSSVAVTGSLQRTAGSVDRSESELRSIVATWSTRIGRSANASAGLRYSSFDSETSPYTESAVFGTLGMRF